MLWLRGDCKEHVWVEWGFDFQKKSTDEMMMMGFRIIVDRMGFRMYIVYRMEFRTIVGPLKKRPQYAVLLIQHEFDSVSTKSMV